MAHRPPAVKVGRRPPRSGLTLTGRRHHESVVTDPTSCPFLTRTRSLRRGSTCEDCSVPAALVAFVLLVPMATSSAGAKAKPTTTTAPTTTTTPAPPTLGVPHVVSSTPNGDLERLESLSCPVGEVALSFAWASIGSAEGGFFTGGNTFVPVHRPIITNGVPTGYEWYETSSPPQAQAHVTCAPLVT
jgi:hypothetical protein